LPRREEGVLGRRGKGSKRQRGTSSLPRIRIRIRISSIRIRESQKRGRRTDPKLDLFNAHGRVDGTQIVTRLLVNLRNFTLRSSLNINTRRLFTGSTALLHDRAGRAALSQWCRCVCMSQDQPHKAGCCRLFPGGQRWDTGPWSVFICCAPKITPQNSKLHPLANGDMFA
jgi:hypothetical protein